jgi:hypothetical protein
VEVFVDSSSTLAAIALVLAGLGLVTMFVMQSLQVSKLKHRIEQLTGGVEGGDLEAVLGEHLESVHQVGRDLDELTARMAVVESAARHFFSREGLVRFNPFPDAGGNQSFALALLDESDDGVIVSSLHSRTGTRIYAKAVTNGKADTSLSAEEQQAIDEARTKRAPRPSAMPRSAAASRPAPATTAVPAPRPVTSQAVRIAKPAPVAPPSVVFSGDEAALRAASLRTKGQEKPKDLSIPEDAPELESEKVERKPGQR